MTACLLLISATSPTPAAEHILRNDRYTLRLADDYSVEMRAKGVSPQTLLPELTVMRSVSSPGFHINHRNYFIAPRIAIRWSAYQRGLASLNRWLNSARMLRATGKESILVTEDEAGKRTWVYRYPDGRTKTVEGMYAQGTIDPFEAGERFTLRATRGLAQADRFCWRFKGQPAFDLEAHLALPPGDEEPRITWQLRVKQGGYYSAAFTGAPRIPAAQLVHVPQQACGRSNRLFGYLMPESTLKLPRAHLSTGTLNSALIVDPKECPFRIPTRHNSRFGAVLHEHDGQIRPVIFAPIMGGAESRMKPGAQHSFTVRYVLRPGDWKDTYRHLARRIYRFRDLRDNSGPGSLNSTLENLIAYASDRSGHNYAMWDDEQKYNNYWSDKAGVFKPFSPIFALCAAIVTDDESLHRGRALPIVEFALSRRSNVFSPYDVHDTGQVASRNRGLGSPYPPAGQLATLWYMFHRRTYALRHYADERSKRDLEGRSQRKPSFMTYLERFRWTGDRRDLGQAIRLADDVVAAGSYKGRNTIFMDLLEIYEETDNRDYLEAAVEAAYHYSTGLNLFPMVPDTNVTVDEGNQAPVHNHSYGRHRLWGFPPPEPAYAAEQTVPAWRPSLIGLESLSYRGEFWMNCHAQLMRIATHANESFLRDLARWGMVGRFANYAGDNRSKRSLIVERADAPERFIWEANFATFNPGHVWEILGAAIDFLISDAFNRSEGQIDFPSRSMFGSHFRTKAYGDRPGRFYDEEGVQLWLPGGLLQSNSRQIDYLAGYGNGKLYLALWNQSFQPEPVVARLSPGLVECEGNHGARVWLSNRDQGCVEIRDGEIKCTVPAKGIVSYAIENVSVRTRLQRRMLDEAALRLTENSLAQVDAPFGQIHGMLLSMGRGLTSAFVYTDALPEDVIEARMQWRQGQGPWQELRDAIFPYEFSTWVDEDAGDYQFVFEVKNAHCVVQRSEPVTLRLR